MAGRGTCTIRGCTEQVPRAGFQLCYAHWKSDRGADTPRQELLSSTKLGGELDLSNKRVNLVFAELGWIEKGPTGKGWVPTDQGLRRGARPMTVKRSGIPYVVWPAEILEDRVLVGTVDTLFPEYDDDETEPEVEREVAEAAPVSDASARALAFRARMPGTLRTQDGHFVRSRGEAMIDDWLYHQQIVHAYERRLPIEQDVYCDFWIPKGKVYIEYWGLESQPKYAGRMTEKKAVYAEHGLSLIEITNAHMNSLDDVLPALLLPFGVGTQ